MVRTGIFLFSNFFLSLAVVKLLCVVLFAMVSMASALLKNNRILLQKANCASTKKAVMKKNCVFWSKFINLDDKCIAFCYEKQRNAPHNISFLLHKVSVSAWHISFTRKKQPPHPYAAMNGQTRLIYCWKSIRAWSLRLVTYFSLEFSSFVCCFERSCRNDYGFLAIQSDATKLIQTNSLKSVTLEHSWFLESRNDLCKIRKNSTILAKHLTSIHLHISKIKCWMAARK